MDSIVGFLLYGLVLLALAFGGALAQGSGSRLGVYAGIIALGLGKLRADGAGPGKLPGFAGAARQEKQNCQCCQEFMHALVPDSNLRAKPDERAVLTLFTSAPHCGA